MTVPDDGLVAPAGFIHRSVEVELKPGEGRTVEAYAAIFDTPAEVRDHEGHYLETIDRAAFNRVINRAKPQGGRDYWLTKVFYNHGKTIHGTPSERYSMPVGVTRHIEADSRGLLTVTEYADTELGNEVLTLIKGEAIRSQSFTGQIVRSDPTAVRGRAHRSVSGQLPTVRRLELGLTEYGPTPLAVYDGAEVVGVRSFDLGTLDALRALLTPAPAGDSGDSGAASDEALAPADDSPAPSARRSARLHDEYSRRLSVALRARGINP